LRLGRQTDVMPLLDGIEARLRQFEIGVSCADARTRCGENVVAFLDVKDDVLDRAIKGKVYGDQPFAGATFCRTTTAEVE
jgi:hypothetical protein